MNLSSLLQNIFYTSFVPIAFIPRIITESERAKEKKKVGFKIRVASFSIHVNPIQFSICVYFSWLLLWMACVPHKVGPIVQSGVLSVGSLWEPLSVCVCVYVFVKNSCHVFVFMYFMKENRMSMQSFPLVSFT